MPVERIQTIHTMQVRNSDRLQSHARSLAVNVTFYQLPSHSLQLNLGIGETKGLPTKENKTKYKEPRKATLFCGYGCNDVLVSHANAAMSCVAKAFFPKSSCNSWGQCRLCHFREGSATSTIPKHKVSNGFPSDLRTTSAEQCHDNPCNQAGEKKTRLRDL